MRKMASLLIALALIIGTVCASEVSRPDLLPAPRKAGGKPLMTALNERQSRREIDSARLLPSQIISDLLWSACGVNRSESGKRTAPSARNRREIDVYLATAADLATVVIGMLDRTALAADMQLGADQKVVLVQPVGYPVR